MCGKASQAEAAKANGGRRAGWILLDDLLDDPGVSLAGQQVESCQDAVAILETGSGSDTVAQLARQSLTAEVNLSAGAESCVASEGAIRVARVLLESVGYQGPGVYGFDEPGAEQLAGETIEILAAHNVGALCITD